MNEIKSPVEAGVSGGSYQNCGKCKSFDDLAIVLKVEDVAKILGIARGSAYALVREGRIRSIRVSSNRLLIPKEAVIEFLQSAS